MHKQTMFTLSTLVFLVLFLSLTSAVSIIDVDSLPTQVAPGETVDILIKIENIFEYDVFNLNVKLDLSGDIPFAPFQSSSEKFLDELEEGDEERFSFKLIVLPSASSGIYKIPVEITYEDEDRNSSSKSELISITINSEPELKVSLEDAILIKGRENALSIRVVNSGLSDVKFMYLKVGDALGVRFLSENEQYLGDIDSDDFDAAEFDIYLSESASGLINLQVTLGFKDSTNKEFTETKSITLRTYSLKEAQELGLVKKPNYTIYVVIGVLVVAYIIRRILKKRKRRKSRG